MESALGGSVFVGRATELAQLTQAAEAAEKGESQAVLVRGEAGVGKTRLVDEFVRNLDPERAVAALGHCVEVGGDGFPFVPFTAVLRSLWRRMPDDVGAASRGREGLLARIVPDLEVPEGAFDRREDDAPRLFELIARILERLASRRLLVVIIEDLHWADASTRHLLEYLFRTPRAGQLLIIATYRSDEVHRTHPLRPFLAEMDRLRWVRRVNVGRFGRVEVAKQLDGLLGGPPEPTVLNEIFLRSDGNAFFVEELARVHRERSGVGLDDLRDVLLARLETLPETSQRIARVASQSGLVISYPLLRAVAGLPEDELIDGLRAITLTQVLVAEPDGTRYRFRHSLVREAISDSLVPGERARINRRYAEALEADASLVPADELTGHLAQHWYAAQDDVKALRMSVAAADAAGHRYAPAEQQRMLERALELWDRVPEDVRTSLPTLRLPDGYPDEGRTAVSTGPDRLDLLAIAVGAAWCSGSLDRALQLNRDALESMSAEHGPPPLRAAWFWVRRSQLVQDLNLGDGWNELRTAEDLLRGLPSSSVHADLLSYMADWSAQHRPGPESLAIAERAVVCANGVGTNETRLRARLTRALLSAESDPVGAGVAELYEVRQRAEALGMAEIIGRVNQYLPWVLEGMGRTDDAITAARHGIAVCRALDMADIEAWLHVTLSVSLFATGQWSESDAELDRAAATARSHRTRGAVAARRAYATLVRGDAERAAGQAAIARDLLGARDVEPQFLSALSLYRIAIDARRGRVDAAREEFLRADAEGLTRWPVRQALPMLCVAAWMEAEASSSSGPDVRSAKVLAAVRQAAAELNVVFPVSRAFEKLLGAELSRAEDADDPQRWASAGAAFATLGRPYELAVSLVGEGRALLRSEETRDAAVERFARAYDIASSLGANLVLADIAALTGESAAPVAVAATSPAPSPPRPPDGDLGLTPRETEVLRLVARGCSNRGISQELHISLKTTSNHVSNILAKLGASSRTEAAAIAHRRGLPVSD